MRKILILLPLAVLLAMHSFAQTQVELIPAAGYTFPSRTDFYDSYGRINGGLNFGGSLKFNLNRNFGLELMYNRMNTQSGLYQYGYGGDKLAGGDLTLDYFMLGGVESFGNGQFAPLSAHSSAPRCLPLGPTHPTTIPTIQNLPWGYSWGRISTVVPG